MPDAPASLSTAPIRFAKAKSQAEEACAYPFFIGCRQGLVEESHAAGHTGSQADLFG